MPMSDFEYLPSGTIDQLAPTLSSTPLSSSPILPTILPSATEHQSEPEPAPALFASIPTPPSTPLHVHSAINESVSTPSSPTSSLCLPSVTEQQPEPEPEPILSITLASTFAPTPPFSSTFLLSPLLSLPPTPLSASLARSEDSTSLSSPTKPPPPETLTSMPAHSLPFLRPSPGEPCCNPVLEPFATPTSLYHPESSLLSLGETIPLLPTQHEASIIVPTSRHPTLPQRPPRIKTFNSDSSSLEVTSAPTLPVTPSVPQLREPLIVHEVTLTLIPHLPLASPSSTLCRSGLAYQVAYFNFAFVLITFAALVLTFFNVSAALLTHTRKFRGKQDINDIWIDTLKASSCDAFTHRLRLGQLTPHAPRLVFDPGGQSSSSSVQVSTTLGTRHTKTFASASRRHATAAPRSTLASPIPVPIDDLIIFDPRGVVERVHWLRARAQFKRWEEEQHSIHNEAKWIPAYFHAKAETWKKLMITAQRRIHSKGTKHMHHTRCMHGRNFPGAQ
ncbi:hypothetical protein EDB85DRAFT_2197813 [Lactarius pseudohatsudake]|nr:hypothetical protein EDB85DRAFT_2197813 [Lactarius pseudohatsudake]